MGRLDALIALIAGSTLAGFVGLVLYALLVAVGALNGGTALAGGAGGYGAGAVAPETNNSGDVAYARHDAVSEGQSVAYLDFGTATPLSGDGTVPVAPIWVFIDGFGDDGRPRMSTTHPTVVDVVPGDPGYSDLWEVQFVLVPAGFDGDLRSLEELNASGLLTMPSGMLVNCPLVPAGSTTSEGHSLRPGWYRGEQIHYFDLGITGITAGDVYEFITDVTNPLGYGAIRTVAPPLIVLPEGDGPTAQFFRVHEVIVASAAEAESIDSFDDLSALGLEVRATGELVNRPLISD